METNQRRPKILTRLSMLSFALVAFALFGTILGHHGRSFGPFVVLDSKFAYDYAIAAVGIALGAAVRALQGAGRLNIALDLTIAVVFATLFLVAVL